MDIVDNFALKAAGFIDLQHSSVNLHEKELLYIAGNRIIGFLTEKQLPENCPVIDVSDTWVLPGLVDTAFIPHLMFGDDGSEPENYGQAVWRAKEASRNWLKAGVTSAATLGAVDRLDKDLGDCIAKGKFAGPRIISALTPLVPAFKSKIPWAYGARQVFGADEARKAARELIKQGADRIVLYADTGLSFSSDPSQTARQRLRFSLEELVEIVEQARHAGCFVHAQAISSAAIEYCAMAGVRSIGCAYQLSPQHFQLLKDNHVAIAPNLALGVTARELGPSVGMGQEVISMVSAQRIAGQTLQAAKNFGLEIICGTNAAFMQGDLVKECLCLEAMGFSSEEVLRSATLLSSQCLKPLSQAGTFTENNFADFLFLGANPLDDLANLRNIEKLMLDGKFVQI